MDTAVSGTALRRVAALVAERAPDTAARLERYAGQVERAPAARQPAILAALAVREPALAHLLPAPQAALEGPATAYPGAPLEVRARLALGDTPAQISGGLTAAEAHRWLSEHPEWQPGSWLAQGVACDSGAAATHTLGVRLCLRDLRVARWLVACWRDPPRRAALERERVERGPHGEEIAGRYLDRVDELRRTDVRSPRDSVEAVFGRAKVRLLREMECSLRSRGEPLHAAPRWWRPVRCARLLLSAADLAAEGRALQHCVAQYVGYVRRGGSVIVGLCVLGHRSTAEIDPRTLELRQHKGPRNVEPHPLCQRALTVCLARWRAARGGVA